MGSAQGQPASRREATSTEQQIAAHKALEERFVKSAIEAKELREEVDKLGAAFIANENPSKRQTAELQRKTDALTKLEARQTQYGAELRRSSTTLKTAGVDTARLTAEEQRLTQGKAQLLQRIQQMGRAVGEQSAKQKQANADIRESATAARSADGAFSGFINRLKGLAAAAIAYVSINKLKEGLLGILSIGGRLIGVTQVMHCAIMALVQNAADRDAVHAELVRQWAAHSDIIAAMHGAQGSEQADDAAKQVMDALGDALGKPVMPDPG